MTKRIYDYINAIFDNLSYEEAGQKLMGQKDGAAKTELVLELLREKNMLPKAMIASNPKNDDESLAARNQGNNFFKGNEFLSALECYNRSICQATGGSENLAIGYANRSAVYLKSGLYEFCHQNIELALRNNYPEKLRPKLEKLRMKCLELMNNRQDSLEKFNKDKVPAKLSYPASEQIPIMIEGLEYARSEQFGRHIVAKRDLYPGDVIIIEKPFAKCVENDSEYKCCANCLNQNYLNLIPCLQCTRAMFCSEDCHQEAWKRFHRYECPIIDEIFDTFYAVILAIRLSLCAFTMFDDPKELEKLIKEINVETESAFTLDYSCLTEHKQFRAIYTLATNESGRTFVDLLEFTNTCASVWHYLSNYTDLHLMLKTKDTEDLFLNILYRFMQLTAVNSHELPLGVGCFALCSLLNHSCAPNIRRVRDGITNVVVVYHVIKAGEQIFDNYVPNHRTSDLKERRNKLKSNYNFVCQCEACVNDFPLLHKMPVPIEFFQQIIGDRKRLRSYDRKFAKRKFKEYRKYLMDNSHKKYPSYEVCSTEDNLIKCVDIVMSDMSLELQLKPL